MNVSRSIITVLAVGLICVLCSAGQQSGTESVEITDPKSGDNVSWQFIVEGNSSATADSGLKVYVLIWPIEANGPWWVQPTTTYSDGSWESNAYFGRDPSKFFEDIGTTYRIAAIMINGTLKEGETLRELPDVPKSARSEKITVKRK